MLGEVLMTPPMVTTIQNIKKLSNTNYEKAALYIEELLGKQENEEFASTENVLAIADNLTEQYKDAFQVLAQ